MAKCFSPYISRLQNKLVPFPCGHCPACREQLSRTWALRMMLESDNYNLQEVQFVTLTYNSQNIPSGYNLSPADLQSFFKRLRRYLPYPIRYYACGEYGERRGRPHYHAIIYGLKKADVGFVAKSWSLGISQVDSVKTVRAFYYCAGYVTKKIGTLSQCSEYYGCRIPPFQRCSLGLGLSIVSKIPIFTRVIRYKGFDYYLGRYLINKLAQKFNIVEKIKQESIDFLYNSVALIESMTSHLDLAGLSPRLALLCRWQEFYAGDRIAFEARLKLKKSRSYDGSS